MRIDFYYWGMQCPISGETIKLLKGYKDKVQITLHDIAYDIKLAEEQKMFFPFLMVVDQKYRYRNPITKASFESLLQGQQIVEKPYVMENPENIYQGDIIPLTRENISLVAAGCTMTDCKDSCNKKGDFLAKYCDGVFGFINVKNGKVLGGVEYVPSLNVPYSIPKDRDTAFLTCVYHSSPDNDFKSAPLKALESYLKRKYNRLLAVTDERGNFPNGNLEWFLSQGYKDEKIISVEKDYCTLHLVSKDLSTVH